MSDDTAIRTGYALPGPGATVDAPAYDYSPLLGRTATLRSCGENIAFDAALPRRGTVTSQIALSDWGDDWLVIAFPEPFEYDAASVTYCLIRARWAGCPVGSEYCPVFVLIDGQHVLSTKGRWSSEDFLFVAWAEVEISE